MAKRKSKVFYNYECTITGEKYKTTKKADNPDELVSVEAYYELNPEDDDRPEHIQEKVKREKEEKENLKAMLEMASEED